MSEYVLIQKENLTAIGDAIREYTGENKLYTLDEMEEKLESQVAKLISGDSIKTFVIPDGTTKIRYSALPTIDIDYIVIPDSVTNIDEYAFSGAPYATINVPWAEGEVSGAPWGAFYGTVNYNYGGE